MRILLAANRYFPDVAGGGNRVAYDCAQYLTLQGHDVGLLCQGIAGKPESDVIDGIRVLRYALPRMDIDFMSRHQRAAKRVLGRHLSGWVPDLIWGHMPLQMAAMIDVFPEVRAVYTLHSPVSVETVEAESPRAFALGLKMKSQVLLQIERRCCEAAAVITVLSQFSRSEIERLHGSEVASKVKISPGWADLTRFRLEPSRSAVRDAMDWPRDRTVFFSIRRLVERMGLDRLIDAAAIVRDRGHKFHLYIAGKGPLRTKLESQIGKLNLDDRVRLVGSVSEKELAAMYGSADAFVLPTRALECFGLVAVEAMSAGSPVLSTPVGALPEIIERIEPKWLARDNSAEAIAELMCAFVGRKLPQHSSEELRHFVETNYAREKALPDFVRATIG
jgi:glycosyltransferase involved in cell wall biosynthesis